MRREYTISFNQAILSEKVILSFLLQTSNVVRFTEVHWRELSFLELEKLGGDNDLKFVNTLNMIHHFFIRKITNNQRYNDIPQRKSFEYNHYFYRLTAKLKALLSKETLFWSSMPPYATIFYGLEDPTFYKEDEIIGSIITHEPIAILYLTLSEMRELKRKGVKFD
ncbi:MAG: hypothetical protein Q7K45_04940 [Nanoarchaeota archaeon]|nr:hypothetical protein [Nanoarchaeota archaeon]